MLLFALFYPIVLLSLFSGCFSADAAVSCALQQSCVLPCSFEPGPDPMIHWTKEPHDQTPVHIYLRGQYQPWHQHQNFRGRTSLFEEGLSTGNASLRLSGVKVQDEGKYKCFANALNTHITTEVYVDVTVYAAAPVSLQPQGQQLLCSSEGVDPKPSVSWSPPSSAARTTLTPSEGGVWSVHSSVPLPHSPPHQYSCNVSDSRGRWRSATYRRDTLIYHTDGSDYVVLPCTEPSAPVKSLIWSFNQNQTILSRSGPEPVYTESWTQFVDGVTKSNSLILKNLTKEQLGLFSCELCTEQQNFIIQTEVTEAEGKSSDLWIIIVVFIVLLIVLFITVLLWWLYLPNRRAQERFRRETHLEGDEEMMQPERDEEMMHPERDEEMMDLKREEEMMHQERMKMMMHPERDEEMMHQKRMERMEMMMHQEEMEMEMDQKTMESIKMMMHQDRMDMIRQMRRRNRMAMMIHPERDQEMMHLKRDEEMMHRLRMKRIRHLNRMERIKMMMHREEKEMMMHRERMKRMEMMHQEGDEDDAPGEDEEDRDDDAPGEDEEDDAPGEDEEMKHLKTDEEMKHLKTDEEMKHLKTDEEMTHQERDEEMMHLEGDEDKAECISVHLQSMNMEMHL